METYPEACLRHAEFQGLSPVMEALTKVFQNDVQLEQTGGFCMVVSVKAPRPDLGFPEAYCWISNDGTEDNPEYVVGWYTEEDQDSVGQGTYEYKYVDSLGAVAEVVQFYRQGAIQVP